MTLLRQKPVPKYRGILQTLDALAAYHLERGHLKRPSGYYKWVLSAREELLGRTTRVSPAPWKTTRGSCGKQGERQRQRGWEERAKVIRGK